MTASAIERHLRWCELRNLRPTYIYQRRQILERTARSIGVALEAATIADVARWHDELRMLPESRAVVLSHLAEFYKWAVAEGIRDDDPMDRLPRPRIRKRMPRPMPPEQLELALAGASSRVRLWLLLGAYAGLRASEVAALRVEDLTLDVDAPVLIVHDGKGGRQRIVPLHPLTVAALGEVDLPAHGWLFPNRSGGHMKANTVCALANRYLRSLGIASTFHATRHYFGTEVYRHTLDLRATQELMGHASPSTTALYAAWTPAAAHRAVYALGV